MKLKEHGETAKHSSSKHHATAKHHPKGKRKAEKGAARQHVHTVAKTAEGAKARKLSPGWDVACCSAEALAASLRLAGGTVRPSDVLGLYWRTASHPDAGASLSGTLRAAQAHGLAGYRPQWGMAWQDAGLDPAADHGTSLLLGLELPGGPHAVTLGRDGTVWSWGEPWEFPDAIVEEVWAVTWS